MKVAFYVVIGALALALIGGALPLLACPLCTPEFDGGGFGADCPVCWDRKRVSFYKRGAEPHKRILDLMLTPGTGEHLLTLKNVLAANGVDDARGSRHGRGEWAFPKTRQGFFDTDEGPRLLVVLSGWRDLFSLRHPHPFPARLFLFDLDARLLDLWEVAPVGDRVSVDLVDAPGAIVVEPIPWLDSALPPDAALDLIVGGTKTRRGASLRVDLRSGRLAVAP